MLCVVECRWCVKIWLNKRGKILDTMPDAVTTLSILSRCVSENAEGLMRNTTCLQLHLKSIRRHPRPFLIWRGWNCRLVDTAILLMCAVAILCCSER